MIYGLLEIEIMNAIWTLQEQDEDVNISISDIVKILDDNKMGRAYTTIKTVMDRLVSKDILVRYKNGKKFFYRSTVERTEAMKSALENVSNQFFNGDYVKMIRFIEKECECFLV